MARIIAICYSCGTEVPMEIDTTEEKFIGQMLKDGTRCEKCAVEYSRNGDDCYYGIPVPDLLAKEYVKELRKPPLAEFLKIVAATDDPLKIRRYKPLALPTEPKTEGGPDIRPRLDYDPILVCKTCGAPPGCLHTKAACSEPRHITATQVREAEKKFIDDMDDDIIRNLLK